VGNCVVWVGFFVLGIVCGFSYFGVFVLCAFYWFGIIPGCCVAVLMFVCCVFRWCSGLCFALGFCGSCLFVVRISLCCEFWLRVLRFWILVFARFDLIAFVGCG